jgi:hypothetical protein
MLEAATLRLCDACGYKVPPGTPRRTREGKKLCPGCWAGRTASAADPVDFVPQSYERRRQTARDRTAAIIKRAHDAGDQVNIYHCPFCGSGQVIGRSDRTVECEFCNAVFTVQVQPMYSAFPQTIDGQPVQEPGMPGMDGQPDVAGDEELPPEAGAVPPLNGTDPGAAGDDSDGDAPPDDDDDESDDNADSDGGNPFAKKKKSARLFRTAKGHLLSEDDYVRHLALAHAATPWDRERLLAKFKAERELEGR